MSKEDKVEKTEEELEAEATAALSAAMDEAIDEVTITPEDEDDGENESDDDDAAGDDDESADADGTDATDDDDESDGDEGSDDSGDEEDASKRKSKDEEAGSESDEDGGTGSGDKSKKGASDKGDDKGEGDATTVKADPINDPIPESTNEKTKERIQSLITSVKEQSALAGERDEMLTAIVNTGSTPEQYTNSLNFLSLYNSSDEKDRRTALQVARGVVNELSIELGEAPPDIIDRHQDLKDEVEAGTLDVARATEIATGRERQTLATSRKTASDEATATQAETDRLVVLGKKQLTDFETPLMSDPTYMSLRPAFIGVLQTTLRSTHPDQWGKTAEEIYTRMKANINVANIEPKPKPKPKNVPLRAKQGAGGGGDKEKEAESAEEAMDRALGEM